MLLPNCWVETYVLPCWWKKLWMAVHVDERMVVWIRCFDLFKHFWWLIFPKAQRFKTTIDEKQGIHSSKIWILGHSCRTIDGMVSSEKMFQMKLVEWMYTSPPLGNHFPSQDRCNQSCKLVTNVLLGRHIGGVWCEESSLDDRLGLLDVKSVTITKATQVVYMRHRTKWKISRYTGCMRSCMWCCSIE